MNCGVCGNLLFPGRAVFRCSCGVLVHAYCWEKHIVESHKPLFVIGNLTVDGEFVPLEPEVIAEVIESNDSTDEELSEVN